MTTNAEVLRDEIALGLLEIAGAGFSAEVALGVLGHAELVGQAVAAEVAAMAVPTARAAAAMKDLGVEPYGEC